VLAAGVFGAARLPVALADQDRAAVAVVDRIPVRDGLPVPPPIRPEQDRFFRYVRNLVPAGESVRIVLPTGERSRFDRRTTGTPGVCGYATTAPGLYLWTVYALYPRPSVCDPAARWTVYLGLPAPPVTAPARLYRFGPNYALVHR
jgi:hypothetical protein